MCCNIHLLEKILLSIYCWLDWLCVVLHGLSPVVLTGLLTVVASLVAEHWALGHVGFSSRGAQAYLSNGMWDLPGPGIKPMFPALAGRFLTTILPGDGETVETVADFILGGSKITAGGDYSYEIKRHLLLGRKVMTNLDNILKSRDITLPIKSV